ncbi:cytochrome P450 [Streptomyces sp. NPDC050504]|uniref:cytochrome P450 n=1 Tax=Streptomyces sp. NPDC050504 TaxID=3365618 RepID=UPI0037B5D602
MHRPPGPVGGRFTGNGPAYDADRLGFVLDATRTHGPLWSFDRSVYVAAGPETCADVLHRTTREFELSGGFLPPPDGAAGHEHEGRHAHAARMRGLRPSAVRRATGMVAEEAMTFAHEWPDTTPVDVLATARTAFSGVAARFVFGADAEPLRHVEQELSRLRAQGAPRRRVRRAMDAAASRIGAAVAARRAHGRDEDDVLGALLRPSQQYGTLRDEVVVHACVLVLLGAQEMPTRALAWILLLLARHPEAADAVAAEAAALPRAPEETVAEDVRGLVRTEAVVREALRLHPPNWLFATRTATVDTRVGGCPVPRGTRVMVTPYPVHRDPGVHPAPDDFRPDRWIGDDGEIRPNAGAVDGGYLPFGTGPRACEGTALAMTELVLFTAHLALRHHIGVDLEGHPVRVGTEGALTPEGLHLALTRRKAATPPGA